MATLLLAALLLTTALSLAMTVYVNGALADTYAGIVGTVAQKYPQAEAQVAQAQMDVRVMLTYRSPCVNVS